MKNPPALFLSHRMDALIDPLIEKLEGASISFLSNQLILVPNNLVKQWLLLEIAKRKGIAGGLKVLSLEEAIFPDRAVSPNRLELFCLIYQALADSTDPSILTYFEGRKERLPPLCEQLAALFSTYGRFGEALFDPDRKPIDWQHEILQKIFVKGAWRAPVQRLSFKIEREMPLHCFGIDSLPPVFWKSLFQFSSLSIYLFSPCSDFWEDVCSDRERRNLNRYWKKRGASQTNRLALDAYLREAPPLLANWGKMGRETLKILDLYEPEMSECYPPIETGADASLLKRVKKRLFSFEKQVEGPVFDPNDSSIRISLCGSSLLREVQILREQILDLVSHSNIDFHEISVLAPDLEPYAPLIEWVFSDSEFSVPYRIFGLDIGSRSPFFQGITRLFALASSRWDIEEILLLFETRSFYRKQGWDGEKLERFRQWTRLASIDWGLDAAHRQTILKKTLGSDTPISPDHGSWKRGVDLLLDGIVYLFPEGSSLQKTRIDPGELEEFLSLLCRLKESLRFAQGEKELGSWAVCLETLAQEYLAVDFSDDVDLSMQTHFRQLIADLKQAALRVGNGLFPSSAIQQFLRIPCPGQIHSSHLHAVRFATLEEGAMIPAKALFIMGMDEESFPRLKTSSSLDLLKRERIAVPECSDRDRYFFLQALFSAQEYFRISYRHLSPEEGKEVNPSLLVQELLSDLGPEAASLAIVHPSLPFNAPIRTQSELRLARAFYGPKRELAAWPPFVRNVELPRGEVSIPISSLSLLARHPWKFYLEKVRGIYLKDVWETSFSLQKNQWLRSSIGRPIEKILAEAQRTFPPGLFGEAFRIDLVDQATEWNEKLVDWGVKNPFSLIFQEGCLAKEWETEDRLALPSIEIEWENHLKVKLVGEIKHATSMGWISTSEDTIAGALKSWPEGLIAAIALDCPQILMIKNGKPKKLDELGDLKSDLKRFLEYYFLCLHAISPLLPEWADPLLRKGVEELEKKREATLSGKALFEDPVIEWLSDRTEIPSAKKMAEEWQPYLKETFAGLVGLYPSKKGGIYAAV